MACAKAGERRREVIAVHVVILDAKVGFTVAPKIDKWVPKSRKWFLTGTNASKMGHSWRRSQFREISEVEKEKIWREIVVRPCRTRRKSCSKNITAK